MSIYPEGGLKTIMHFIVALPFRLIATNVLFIPIFVLGIDALLFGFTLLSFTSTNTQEWLSFALIDVFEESSFTENDLYRVISYMLVIVGGIASVFTKYAPNISKKFIAVVTNRNILLISYLVGYIALIISIFNIMDFGKELREDPTEAVLILSIMLVFHIVAYYLHKLYFLFMKISDSIKSVPSTTIKGSY